MELNRFTHYEPVDPHPSDDVDVRHSSDPRLSRDGAQGRSVRLAIVLLVKNPIAFDTWLRHHLDKIGVHHIYVRSENSRAELSGLAEREPRVTVEFAEDTELNYFSLIERQINFITSVIDRARNAGCTHLLHIDDDELLHCPSGTQKFYAYLASMKYDCITIRNIEAVYEKSECENPFLGEARFVTRPVNFTAYANGKSIANLTRSTTIKPNGPHLFTGTTRVIPSSHCVVLHYESSCIQRWQSKFRNYKMTTPDACDTGKIPFAFYCESMRDSSPDTWMRWKSPSRHDENTMVLIDPTADA
jgi:hypothetical protein